MSLALRYAARSDRGLIRGKNDDSVYAGPRLLAVADGMGGYAGGDVASRVIIAALEHLDEERPTGDMLAALASSVNEGSEHIRELVREDSALDGMGTTLTALLFAGPRLALCHVGDSRGYLLRDNEFSQITHDDTFVQALIDEGRITEEEARSHPQRSLILRALNGNPVDPDLSIREARLGDRFLLCSDGLSGVVSDETMHEAMLIPDVQECADRMIELALRGGGPDNITCVIADVIDDSRDGELASIDPVVDGAAGDYAGQRAVRPVSSAARAALASPERQAAPQQVVARAMTAPPPRRRRRLLIGIIAALVVLAVGAVGVYVYVMAQYFVGVQSSSDGDTVAIFRGVNADLLGIDFYRLEDDTGIDVADLNSSARSTVEDGIPADDLAGAQQVLENLQGELLPLCPEPRPTPTLPTPAPGPSAPPTVPSTSTPTTAETTSSTRSGDSGATCREGE